MGGGWAILFVVPRGPGRRVRGRGGAFCVLGVSLALWAASAWALTALILCQTLCRLRGRCTRPARALPFGTPWGGARGLVGRLGRVPSPESDWCAFGGGRPPENGAPWPLFVRSVPTTRCEESSWVPWRGCTVNLFWAISQSLRSLAASPSIRKLNAGPVLRRVKRRRGHFS